MLLFGNNDRKEVSSSCFFGEIEEKNGLFEEIGYSTIVGM